VTDCTKEAHSTTLAATFRWRQVGDGTNYVITLAGELLSQAEELLNMGLHPSEIIAGYEKAADRALEALDGMLIVAPHRQYENGARSAFRIEQ
jgi:T-complex protein 1 subunit theta